MTKPVFCMWKKKDADQLHIKHSADQCLCLLYIDGTKPLLLNFKPVAFQPGLCRTLLETLGTGFLMTQLILYILVLI